MAVQPEAKTLSSSHRLTAAVAPGSTGSGVAGRGWPAFAAANTRQAPTPITISSVPVNR